MNNPLIHTAVFILAVVIPGGLLVYFGWRINRAHEARKLKKEQGPRVQKIPPEK